MAQWFSTHFFKVMLKSGNNVIIYEYKLPYSCHVKSISCNFETITNYDFACSSNLVVGWIEIKTFPLLPQLIISARFCKLCCRIDFWFLTVLFLFAE